MELARSIQLDQLHIRESPQYKGLSHLRVLRNSKFSQDSSDPLYQFPLIRQLPKGSVRATIDFTCADSVDLKHSLAQLQEKSPFKQQQQERRSRAGSDDKSFQGLSFDKRNTSHDHYTFESKLSISFQSETPGVSMKHSDKTQNLYVYSEETSHNSLELSDVEPFIPPTRQFLYSPASKSKFLALHKLTPPDLASPILRKLVICFQGKAEDVLIGYSAVTAGFTSALSLAFSPESNAAFVDHDDTGHLLTLLMPQSILTSLMTYSVEWVSCGYEHIAAVTTEGRVLTWGYGASGCLGHGTVTSLTEPRLVDKLLPHNVVYLECGGFHTAAVTEEGQLWTWGRGDVHQLGISPSEMQYDDVGYLALIPLRTPLQNICSVACGEAHTLALDFNGKVYAFGWADEGQLGVANYTGGIGLVKLPFKLMKIAAGAVFSVGLADNGNVYVWGKGDKGQLGLGNRVKKIAFPALVGGLKGGNVVDVVCGECHVVCVTSNGEVYGWGKGVEDIENKPEATVFEPRLMSNIEIVHRYFMKNANN